MSDQHKQKRLFLLLLITLAALAILPFIGMEKIRLSDLLFTSADGIKNQIFWKIRLPRVLGAFLAGAGLSLSGMAFQAMFRNPLATPFTLGVSSGAAFGAAVYVRLGLILSLGWFSGQSIGAFLGAFLAIMIVYGLTQLRRGFSTGTLLLAGVAVNFFFSSVIMFIQYLSDFTHSFRIIRWLMGGFEIVGYQFLASLLPFVIVGSLVVFRLTNELNLMTLGEDLALSRGVNVRKVKNWLFFATSMMVGGVVATCGPIGFVGMMAPHMCRLIIGADHRYLAPTSFLFGGLFLAACDTLARTLIAPVEIPVGVITALLGGPFFLWLLLSGSSEKSLMK